MPRQKGKHIWDVRKERQIAQKLEEFEKQDDAAAAAAFLIASVEDAPEGYHAGKAAVSRYMHRLPELYKEAGNDPQKKNYVQALVRAIQAQAAESAYQAFGSIEAAERTKHEGMVRKAMAGEYIRMLAGKMLNSGEMPKEQRAELQRTADAAYNMTAADISGRTGISREKVDECLKFGVMGADGSAMSGSIASLPGQLREIKAMSDTALSGYIQRQESQLRQLTTFRSQLIGIADMAALLYQELSKKEKEEKKTMTLFTVYLASVKQLADLKKQEMLDEMSERRFRDALHDIAAAQPLFDTDEEYRRRMNERLKRMAEQIEETLPPLQEEAPERTVSLARTEYQIHESEMRLERARMEEQLRKNVCDKLKAMEAAGDYQGIASFLAEAQGDNVSPTIRCGVQQYTEELARDPARADVSVKIASEFIQQRAEIQIEYGKKAVEWEQRLMAGEGESIGVLTEDPEAVRCIAKDIVYATQPVKKLLQASMKAREQFLDVLQKNSVLAPELLPGKPFNWLTKYESTDVYSAQAATKGITKEQMKNYAWFADGVSDSASEYGFEINPGYEPGKPLFRKLPEALVKLGTMRTSGEILNYHREVDKGLESAEGFLEIANSAAKKMDEMSASLKATNRSGHENSLSFTAMSLGLNGLNKLIKDGNYTPEKLFDTLKNVKESAKNYETEHRGLTGSSAKGWARDRLNMSVRIQEFAEQTMRSLRFKTEGLNQKLPIGEQKKEFREAMHIVTIVEKSRNIHPDLQKLNAAANVAGHFQLCAFNANRDVNNGSKEYNDVLESFPSFNEKFQTWKNASVSGNLDQKRQNINVMLDELRKATERIDCSLRHKEEQTDNGKKMDDKSRARVNAMHDLKNTYRSMSRLFSQESVRLEAENLRIKEKEADEKIKKQEQKYREKAAKSSAGDRIVLEGAADAYATLREISHHRVISEVDQERAPKYMAQVLFVGLLQSEKYGEQFRKGMPTDPEECRQWYDKHINAIAKSEAYHTLYPEGLQHNPLRAMLVNESNTRLSEAYMELILEAKLKKRPAEIERNHNMLHMRAEKAVGMEKEFAREARDAFGDLRKLAGEKGELTAQELEQAKQAVSSIVLDSAFTSGHPYAKQLREAPTSPEMAKQVLQTLRKGMEAHNLFPAKLTRESINDFLADSKKPAELLEKIIPSMTVRLKNQPKKVLESATVRENQPPVLKPGND